MTPDLRRDLEQLSDRMLRTADSPATDLEALRLAVRVDARRLAELLDRDAGMGDVVVEWDAEAIMRQEG